MASMRCETEQLCGPQKRPHEVQWHMLVMPVLRELRQKYHEHGEHVCLGYTDNVSEREAIECPCNPANPLLL